MEPNFAGGCKQFYGDSRDGWMDGFRLLEKEPTQKQLWWKIEMEFG